MSVKTDYYAKAAPDVSGDLTSSVQNRPVFLTTVVRLHDVEEVL